MKSTGWLIGFAIVVLAGCSGPKDPGEVLYGPVPGAGSRVGTVDRTELLVAFARSHAHSSMVRALVASRDAARASGDSAGVRACEREGRGMQDRLHRQLMGREPLTDVIEALGPGLEGVARDLGVASIVTRGLKLPEGATGTDATPAVVALLPERPVETGR